MCYLAPAQTGTFSRKCLPVITLPCFCRRERSFGIHPQRKISCITCISRDEAHRKLCDEWAELWESTGQLVIKSESMHDLSTKLSRKCDVEFVFEDERLIGVNVSINGTATGTVTGLDGLYSIQVPGGDDHCTWYRP